MDFRTFFRPLSSEQREAFAAAIHSTVGYCHQIAYGGKRIELGLADAIVAVAPSFGGALSLTDLELTDRARLQDEVRRGGGVRADVHGSAVCAAAPEST